MVGSPKGPKHLAGMIVVEFMALSPSAGQDDLEHLSRCPTEITAGADDFESRSLRHVKSGSLLA